MSAAPAHPARRFELTAPPPVRALAISAAAAVGAIALFVVSQLASATALAVVAAVVLGLGLILAVVALVLTRRLRTSLVLAEETLTFRQAGRATALKWVDITAAGLDRGRLLLTTAGGQTVITIPRGARDPQFAELHAALRTHLNASRGYSGPALA